MKIGVRNIAHKVNASSLKSCVRPGNVQKLVSAEVKPKIHPGNTPYETFRPVNIRICTRKDMERTCPLEVNFLLSFKINIKIT